MLKKNKPHNKVKPRLECKEPNFETNVLLNLATSWIFHLLQEVFDILSAKLGPPYISVIYIHPVSVA